MSISNLFPQSESNKDGTQSAGAGAGVFDGLLGLFTAGAGAVQTGGVSAIVQGVGGVVNGIGNILQSRNAGIVAAAQKEQQGKDNSMYLAVGLAALAIFFFYKKSK